jgi:hypothetical protein
MAFLKQNSARHRAQVQSHAVRNTTIAAAAGAAILGLWLTRPRPAVAVPRVGEPELARPGPAPSAATAG